MLIKFDKMTSKFYFETLADFDLIDFSLMKWQIFQVCKINIDGY